MERCEDCGFNFEALRRDDVSPRVLAAGRAIVAALGDTPGSAKTRPDPGRWSNVEYVAHVRDVLLTIRDRLVIGLVETNPAFKSLYRDERVDLGLYASDAADAVAAELECAAAMLTRLFDAIDPTQLGRMVQYGSPDPVPRSLLWMGFQAVHESEHHLGDIEENIARFSA